MPLGRLVLAVQHCMKDAVYFLLNDDALLVGHFLLNDDALLAEHLLLNDDALLAEHLLLNDDALRVDQEDALLVEH
ncbi:hypothetical protein PF008_g7783 [Phytophthora fragariae]|uniref:Uncharacterized protein n=1 Tax=Phytophthora fragariae TaxID=53985 RepID=A0A6G0S229_9STRA|nr:hypothetical protein PF008_g7783 [Phytophthora fragariae]